MDDEHIQALLDELLEFHTTPEEVCSTCPEILPELRLRWNRMKQVQNELDALFPSSIVSSSDRPLSPTIADLPEIPGYEMQAVLGRGGMGIVFRARQKSLNRIVALKMALSGVYASSHDRERFQREAEAVAALSHPNIVQIHDVGESGGRPYFTMEFLEGGSLAQKVNGTPQPVRDTAQLLATVAEGVDSAHQRSIVHRDLKPSNILLAIDGTPKISDFGLARRLNEREGITRTGTTLGTPSYMAPEQASPAAGIVGPAADIYALGAILYEMLTGQPPFHSESPAQTIQQVLTRDPVPPSRLNNKVPRDLETICLQCLRKEQHLRYDRAASLAEDLQRFLRGEAITARHEGRLRRLARQIRRHPLQASLVGGVTLLATVLICGGLWLMSDRIAEARAADAALVAIEQAVEADLQDMERSLRVSAWPEARGAAQRVHVRLGTGDFKAQRARVARGQRDMNLAEQLELLRLGGSDSVGGIFPTEHADELYNKVFVSAGLGSIRDLPDELAARIATSNINQALLAALDHWSACCTPENQLRRIWILEVARQADPDQTPWRVRARDPEVRKNQAALLELIATASVEEQPVALLISLEMALHGASNERLPFLRRLHSAHPDDFWVNHRLVTVLSRSKSWPEAMRYGQAAIAIRPTAAPLHNNLGTALSELGHYDDALQSFRRAVALDPQSSVFRANLVATLVKAQRYDELVKSAPLAIQVDPQNAMLHTAFAIGLDAKMRDAEALVEHQKATMLDPKRSEAQRELRKFLMSRGRWDEAKAAWLKAIEADPDSHNAWYGYAEFCLFRDDVEEYRRTRAKMLSKFSVNPTNQTAERTARAALLFRASSPEESEQVQRFAKQVAEVEKGKAPNFYPYFQFVQGLAEYRSGRFADAANTMRREPAKVLGAAPALVLAMSQYQLGKKEEARQTVAGAIAAYNWDVSIAREQDAWINHILQREAKALINADSPAASTVQNNR